MDIGGCIILKYKNGGMASLMYHSDTPEADNTAVILGDKGMIKV